MLPFLLTAWRRVVLAALVMLVCTASACAPRDPLDREVEAHTLAGLRAWLAETQRAADPELAREIELVFLNLASQTPRFHPPTTERELHQRGNPLCRRVHGRRLRDVMIDSYDSAITTLNLQNNIDADNLLRLSSVVNTDRADAFAKRIEFVKAEIAKRDERIKAHRERIDQLRGQ